MKKDSVISTIYKRVNSCGTAVTFCVAIAVFIVCMSFAIGNKISSANYISYRTTAQQSVLCVAQSVAPESANIWQVVHEIKSLNGLSGDTVSADTIIKVPASYVDSNIPLSSTEGLLCLK